jgi:alkyl sulfatase BDS1-like metallo-beta-lactamase superfamily hydrolase
MADSNDLGDMQDLSPQQFAQLVRSTPDAKIAEVMGSDRRTGVLDAIFARFPSLFRADRAGSTNAVIHWVITGRPDGGSDTYELVIADGTCTQTSQPAHTDPRLAITIGPVEFLKLIAGTANPMTLTFTGKLKIKGDTMLAANIANLFEMPRA